MPPETVKRLRIRLKATDRGSLARMFGRNVRSDGVRINTSESLAHGTAVVVEIQYQSGALALSGEGTIASAGAPPGARSAGLEIALRWSDESRLRVDWILEEVEARRRSESARVKAPCSAVPPPATDPPVPEPPVREPPVPEPPAREPPAPEPPAREPPVPEPPAREPPAREPPAREPPARKPPAPEPLHVAPLASLAADLQPPPITPAPFLAHALPAIEALPLAAEPWPPAEAELPSLAADPLPPVEAEPSPLAAEPIPSPAALASFPPAPEPTPASALPEPPGASESVRALLRLTEADQLRISTAYAQYHSDSARDEIGPSPVPDALKAGEITPKPPEPLSVQDRQSGEVTPLARIELVRQSPAPAPRDEQRALDAAAAGSPLATAVRSKRSRRELPAKSRLAIGIDLGTTSTRAAIVQNGRVRLIPSRRGPLSIVSAISIDAAGTTIIGEPAMRQLRSRPSGIVTAAKRLIGRPFHSPLVQRALAAQSYELVEGDDGETAVRFGEFLITLEELSALILKEVREGAWEYLGERVNRAVITCPGHFGERQREAIRLAGELAGFHVERVISEPLAAAMSYTLGHEDFEGRLLVYDLGGGTFDASLIEIEDQLYRAIAHSGDSFLGGLDFDACIAERLAEEVFTLHGVDPRGDPGAMAQLGQAAERVKRELTDHPVTRIAIEDLRVRGSEPMRIEMPISRALIEPMFDPLVERTLRRCLEVCTRAKIAPSKIDRLVMVGGQTLSPIVRRRVRELFDLDAATQQFEPEHAVAIGAARYAERIGEPGAPELVDVLSESIGIARPHGRFQRIIEQDSRFPVSGTVRFDVTLNGEDGYSIFLFQGEHERVLDNELIANLAVSDFPDGLTSGSVTVQIELTAEGFLQCSATEDESGHHLSTRLITKVPPEELDALFAAPDLSETASGAPFGAPPLTEAGVAPGGDGADRADSAVAGSAAPIERDGGGLFGWIKKTLGGPKRRSI